MEDGELLILLICLVLAIARWGTWYRQTVQVRPLGSKGTSGRLLQLAPVLCLGLLGLVLCLFSAADVRASTFFLCFYAVLGAAWLALVERVGLRLGLSALDDALERGNVAAAVAITGLLLGGTLAFAGANIGEGPGWYVVVFCALLSTGGLLLAWVMLNLVAEVAEAISVERDLATAIRAAGFFLGSGLILGRAVAGDWTSLTGTLADFARSAWPTIIILALAAGIERLLRPTATRPKPPALTWGVLPAMTYLGLGILVVLLQGAW